MYRGHGASAIRSGAVHASTALALLHGGAELYEYTGVLLGGLTWPAWRLDLRRLLNQAADLGWRVVATVVYYHAKAVYNMYVDLAYVPVHALRVVGVTSTCANASRT